MRTKIVDGDTLALTADEIAAIEAEEAARAAAEPTKEAQRRQASALADLDDHPTLKAIGSKLLQLENDIRETKGLPAVTAAEFRADIVARIT